MAAATILLSIPSPTYIAPHHTHRTARRERKKLCSELLALKTPRDRRKPRAELSRCEWNVNPSAYV